MKALHINEHLKRKGGVETYMLSLLPLLEEQGVRSTVVYGAGDASEYENSIQVPGIGDVGFRGQAAVRQQMKALLASERPDVIHIHNVQNVGVVQACLDYGVTVMTAHDYRAICPAMTFFYRRTQEVCTRQCGVGCFSTTLTKHCLTPRPQYAGYFYYRAKWNTKNALRFGKIIAPCSYAQDRLLQAGFDSDQVTVLPYFCPLEPLLYPRSLPKRPTITFMGRIAPNKGHEFFVQALGKLPGEVQGIMVGNFTDTTERTIRQLAQQQGCENRLSLRNWASRDEVLQILDDTTVFIFPSLWPETLGIVGLEALARGVPVVASDIGGVREWLRDGENGILVQPKAPDQISAAVLSLIKDERQLNSFGECGINTIKEKFMPSQHTTELIRNYEQVVRSSR